VLEEVLVDFITLERAVNWLVAAGFIGLVKALLGEYPNCLR